MSLDDQVQWMERAQGALEDLARATGLPFSSTPKDGSLSLFCDPNNNVYAMLVTGLDSAGNVERGVTPFGDPPMTPREFVAAATMAEAAVYAVHQNRSGGRLDRETQARVSRQMVDLQNEADLREKAQGLLDALTTEIGAPSLRVMENELGLVAIDGPSPFGQEFMPAGLLADAFAFSLNAVEHHERYQQRIEHSRRQSDGLNIDRD